MSISIGKWRRLQQCASPERTFSVLAVDHRGPLRRALQRQSAIAVSDEELTSLKQDIVRALGSVSSAVLLDPETSVGQCIANRAICAHTGLITALDTGSTGDPAVRVTGLVDGWSVEKVARVGASGVKLLVYYHPDSAEAVQCQQLVETTGRECARHDVPFFLEPLSCTPDVNRGPLSSRERREVVVESARRLVPLGVDVLKAEFPVDVHEQPDEVQWRDACQQLTAACPVPWVLLSAGVDFETFVRQAKVACDAGASGVMVGRAVWKEAVTSDSRMRNEFLRGVGRDRMQRLRKLCDNLARPLTEVYSPPQLTPDWYKEYGT